MKNADIRYLILGNSTAAVGAIEAIRKIDADGAIVLIGREPRHVYSRPLISYLLAGEIDESRMDYRPRDFYARHQVDARLGVRALRVDPRLRTVRVTPVSADGSERNDATAEELRFETLLIATGGAPVVPPIEGRDASGVFTFATWDDADRLTAWIEKRNAQHAVVVGGGLIGIKAAEALRARGARVLIVEREDRVLPLGLDRHASSMAATALRDAGVDLECGTIIERIVVADGVVSGVTFHNGRESSCDLVVMAAGVAPDASIVHGTAIRVDHGVLVDARSETSVPGIYAAGDVAQGIDSLSGASRPIPIFPHAYRQGAVAGTNMAGGQATFNDAFAQNAVDVCGLSTISIGLATAEGGDFEVLTTEDQTARTYKRVVLRDGRIVGALFVGDIDRVGIFTGLIREKIDVTSFKHLLLSGRLGLITLPEGYRRRVVSGEAVAV
ncbi:MAG: NAD(P)/FAD-dependent oxidoreductase [Vicinamibacteria bacterium]|nr:NAD(P)/FAD-dependent oxidoreductase [Vicinamibacteria bacterium]